MIVLLTFIVCDQTIEMLYETVFRRFETSVYLGLAILHSPIERSRASDLGIGVDFLLKLTFLMNEKLFTLDSVCTVPIFIYASCMIPRTTHFPSPSCNQDNL